MNEHTFVKGKDIFVHKINIPTKLVELIVDEYTQNIDSRPLINGKIVGSPNEKDILNVKERNCEIEWIPLTGWAAPLLWYHISGINNQYFRYDIINLESIQLTSYSKGEFYNWHVDSTMNNNDIDRKLTCVLQLSDKDDYEGGELQVLHPGYHGMEVAPKEKGSLIVFDSRLAHRVKPIKSGRRISLVSWAIGPRWR
jgi:PKHD-type hydroxylase